MKLFKISSEDRGNVLPHIKGWTDRLDYHTVQSGEILKLPRRTLLYVENHPETVFADVIDMPFLLVSDMVWTVMNQYDSGIKGRQIVLLDDIYGIAESYRMPMLLQYSRLSMSQGWKTMPPFFRLDDGKRKYMAGRQDFVESILRRGAKGIRLQEIDMEQGGEAYVGRK